MDKTLTLAAAFLAGTLSFLSPCVLPLVPTYLLYLGAERGRPLVNAAFFVLGFSLVFLALGLPFTLLGGLLMEHRRILTLVGGAAMILFGLLTLGLGSRFLSRQLTVRFAGDASRPWGALGLGAALGVAWTPCIGPILGAILTLTATGAGAAFLVAYVAGLALPFLILAFFSDRARGWVRGASRAGRVLRVVGGLVMVAVGVLMLTGQFTVLNGFFLRLTPQWLLERL